MVPKLFLDHPLHSLTFGNHAEFPEYCTDMLLRKPDAKSLLDEILHLIRGKVIPLLKDSPEPFHLHRG